MVRGRFVRLDLRFALDSLGGDLERPGKNQRDWETGDQEQDDKAHSPIRNLEERKNLRRNLNQHPRCDCISDRDFVNVAPLEFGKEIIGLHFGFSSQSFWKRGSPRRESKSESRRSRAAVKGGAPSEGLLRIRSTLEMACSFSPNLARTRARNSSACDSERASAALSAAYLSRVRSAASRSPN